MLSRFLALSICERLIQKINVPDYFKLHWQEQTGFKGCIHSKYQKHRKAVENTYQCRGKNKGISAYFT